MTARVLVAPDDFKGTFTAPEVAAAIAGGIRAAGLEADELPIADGGGGTMTALHASLGGELRTERVGDPLGRPVDARWLLLPDGRTAVVEMAEASGLSLVAPEERDPWRASTAGTGELIAAAARAGAATVLVAVGGSATTDGGAGAVAALREAGAPVPTLRVICDVRVPFEDCARVFGPQKGADAAMIERLTRRLHELAERAPRDPRGRPMTGAAGGLSGGLWAFLGAELVEGAPYVLDAVHLDDRLAAADAVVSGEGRLDDQTLTGKAIAELARRCRASGRPLYVVAGSRTLGDDDVAALGLAGVREATTLEELREAGRAVAAAVARRSHG